MAVHKKQAGMPAPQKVFPSVSFIKNRHLTNFALVQGAFQKRVADVPEYRKNANLVFFGLNDPIDALNLCVIGGRAVLVNSKRVFSGRFEKGKTVLQLHTAKGFSANNLHHFLGNKTRIKMLDKIKSNGFEGIFFDTPNTRLIELAKKLGFVEIPISKVGKIITTREYKRGVRVRGFPKQFVGLPARRFVLKF